MLTISDIMAGNPKATLNTLYQQLKLGSPVYDCFQEETGGVWTCSLTCPATPADRDLPAIGLSEKGFSTSDTSKKAASSAAAAEALQYLASLGLDVQKSAAPDTLLDAIQQALQVMAGIPQTQAFTRET